jgi:hypothetical protein
LTFYRWEDHKNSLKIPPLNVQLKKTEKSGKALDKSLKKCSNWPPEN